MKRRLFLTVGLVAGIGVALVAGMFFFARGQAHTLLTQPVGTHSVPLVTPAAYGLDYEDVLITSTDEMHLLGWYIPSQNGAAVIAQHGYKNNRGEMLNEAALLARHGYGVLLSSVRAHDYSDGERISFGIKEMDDLEAWYQYLLTRADVDPDRIGVLGNSYGGSLVIQYASQNPAVKAVVANSSFSSLDDTVTTSVSYFTGLPPYPFAPMIVWWAEREGGFQTSDIDTAAWVGQISPRPILLMQGGADIIVSPTSGERLYAAAGEPKQLWYEEDLGHTMFDSARPREYESRVIQFFDRYLLGTAN